jgi:hypothetical protein
MRNGYIDMNNEGREMSVEKVLRLFLNYSKAKNLSKRTIVIMNADLVGL